MIISKRLKAIAKLVEGRTVADIGCDGANLAIWLAQNKNFFIYACDLRAGPLKKAKCNLEKFNISNNIKLIQADGLLGVPSSVDEVIISGLGGEQIEKIVLSCRWLKNFNVKLILQPQSFSVRLKQSLYRRGFFIEKQVCVVDRKKVYLIFVVKFCGLRKKLNLKEALVGGLSRSDETSCAWIRFQRQKLKRILNSLSFAKQTDEVLLKKLKLNKIYSILSSWEVF